MRVKTGSGRLPVHPTSDGPSVLPGAWSCSGHGEHAVHKRQSHRPCLPTSEFVKARRAAKGFAHRHDAQNADGAGAEEGETPGSASGSEPDDDEPTSSSRQRTASR